MPVENPCSDSSTDTLPEELLITDSDNRRQEIWPTFTCPACQSDTDYIRWETTSIPDDMKPDPQHYTGHEPCCFRCGTALNERTRDKHRPEQWKQPILHVTHSITGLSSTHPAITNIYNTYEHAPKDFLTASRAELQSITGIGDTWADKIHTNRATIYPDHTPPVDGELYPFRGRRITDVTPHQIATDLALQHVSIEELPHTTDDTTIQSHLADVAAVLTRDDFYAGGLQTDTPNIDVQLVTETLTS